MLFMQKDIVRAQKNGAPTIAWKTYLGMACILCLQLLNPSQAFAQAGPVHMLPPLNCPNGGNSGLLAWRDDGTTSLGCSTGITVDTSGNLVVSGNAASTSAAPPPIPGSITATGTVKVGTDTASACTTGGTDASGNPIASTIGAVRYNNSSNQFEGCANVNGTTPTWTPLLNQSPSIRAAVVFNSYQGGAHWTIYPSNPQPGVPTFSGGPVTGPAQIYASNNIASINQLGPASYQINFATPLKDTNYVVLGSFGWNGAGDVHPGAAVASGLNPSNISVNSVTIQAEETPYVAIAILGLD